MRFPYFFSLFIIVLITTTFNTSIFAKRAAIVIDYDTDEVLLKLMQIL